MNIGLYQSAASLSSLERWQDAVTQNITSAQVAGYKKRTIQFDAVTAGELRADTASQSATGEGESYTTYFPKVTYGVSFTGGETQPTRRELDVALQGEGFFEVQMPDGTKAYTRAGELRVRPDRTLVTASDAEILSTGGNPIQLLPQGGKVTINQDGSIVQGDATIGRLAVTQFADTSKLIPLSAGVFMAGAGAGASAAEEPEVLQGYLEASNVTPLREMVDLVQIARAYEANQKLIQSRDESMKQTLEKLG